MTRRTVVRASAVIGAAVAVGSMAPTASAADAGTARARGPKRPATSANGWTVEANADRDSQVWTSAVAGTGLSVPLWIGDVGAVLVHVVRRFHYEVQELAAVGLACGRAPRDDVPLEPYR
ncbi:hypothetical protein [Streptomyces sp. Agncl-13]|uniref:hypothetical protein n=1 Tax=Streptomyces sp. Agncl-13 TaxID=3400628 RepID=UPI003A890298